MENHHHCKYCGNMIRPSLNVCEDCRTKGIERHIEQRLEIVKLLEEARKRRENKKEPETAEWHRKYMREYMRKYRRKPK